MARAAVPIVDVFIFHIFCSLPVYGTEAGVSVSPIRGLRSAAPRSAAPRSCVLSRGGCATDPPLSAFRTSLSRRRGLGPVSRSRDLRLIQPIRLQAPGQTPAALGAAALASGAHLFYLHQLCHLAARAGGRDTVRRGQPAPCPLGVQVSAPGLQGPLCGFSAGEEVLYTRGSIRPIRTRSRPSRAREGSYSMAHSSGGRRTAPPQGLEDG